MTGRYLERLCARHRADNREASIIACRLLEDDVRAAIGKDMKIADRPVRAVHPETFNVRGKFRRGRKFLIKRCADNSRRGLRSGRSGGAHRDCPKGPPNTAPGTISSIVPGE